MLLSINGISLQKHKNDYKLINKYETFHNLRPSDYHPITSLNQSLRQIGKTNDDATNLLNGIEVLWSGINNQ